MTTGQSNWNGDHVGASWCCRDASGMQRALRQRRYHCCCTAATAGRQAGPRGVFSRAIATIFIATKLPGVNLATKHHAKMLSPCYEPTCANAVALLILIDYYRQFYCCSCGPVGITAPEWFWFGLRSFTFLTTPSHSRSCLTTLPLQG